MSFGATHSDEKIMLEFRGGYSSETATRGATLVIEAAAFDCTVTAPTG